VTRYRADIARAERTLGDTDAGDFPLSAGLLYLALGSELAPAAPSGPAPSWTAGWEMVHQSADVAGPARAIYLGDQFDESETTRQASITNLALWGERRFQPASALTVAPGLRVEMGTPLRGSGAVRVSPRLSARFAPGDSTILYSAALGRSYQYTQSLAARSPVRPSTPGFVPLWLMADADLPALRTELLTVGAERWLGDRWHGAVNAYVRRSAGMLVPDPRPGSITGHELFVEGRESAHGAEASLRRIQGRWTTSLGYQYGVATIRAADEAYAATEDRRQSFDMTVLSRVGRGWRAGAAFTAAGGAPYTRMDDGEPAFDVSTGVSSWNPAPATEAPNGVRMPDYQGLDLLVEWSGRWWRLDLQLHDVYSQGNYLGYSGYSRCSGAPGARACPGPDRYVPGPGLQPFVGVRITF
jgi:hypothetical protein